MVANRPNRPSQPCGVFGDRDGLRPETVPRLDFIETDQMRKLLFSGGFFADLGPGFDFLKALTELNSLRLIIQISVHFPKQSR